MSSYEKNIEVLFERDPAFAYRLLNASNATLPSGYKCKPPVEENVLVVFEVGANSCFADCMSWLDLQDDHYILIVDTQIDHFKDLFSQKDLVALIQHPRVWFIDEVPSERLKEALWTTVFLEKKLSSPKEFDRQTIEALTSLESSIHMVASEYRDFSQMVLANTTQNLSKLHGAIHGKELEGKAENCPIVICGAGPSIEGQIDMLKKIENKVLILASGSAFKILRDHDVKVWALACLDPDPPRERYTSSDLPLFYQNRIAEGVLANFCGKRIWMGGFSTLPVEDWFIDRLGLSTLPMDTGWNVSNFAMQIAIYMGAKEIIFTGMDIGITDEKIYPSSMVPERVELEAAADRKDLIMGAKWIEQLAKEHPEISFYNATTSERELEGIARTSLEDLDRRLTNDCSFVWPQTSIEVDEREIDRARKELSESFKISTTISARFCELLAKGCDQQKFLAIKAVFETDIASEIAHTLVLKPLWDIWKHVLLRKKIEGVPPQVGETLSKALFFGRVLSAIDRHEDGIKRGYNEEGVLLTESFFVEGKREGPQYLYYREGGLYAVERFAKGVRDGMQTFYHRNGSIKTEVNYHNGKLSGIFRLFWPEGQIKREAFFENGQLQGKQKLYAKDGTLTEEGNFSQGSLIGAQYRYALDGTLLEELYYHAPNQFDRKAYNRLGELIYEGKYEGNQHYFESRYNSNNEKVTRKAVLDNGQLIWERAK